MQSSDVFIPQVEGWLDRDDALLFSEILTAPVIGDTLEIGCYMGQTAILMGTHMRLDETVVICDIFDGMADHKCLAPGHDAQYGSDLLNRFLANWDRYHPKRPELHVCDSLALADKIVGRSFRFIHVDGCHSYACAKEDILLAARHSTPHGVVAVDNFRTAHLPGVAAAAWEVVAEGVLHPFCSTSEKLYLATSVESHAEWLSQIAYAIPGTIQSVMGRDMSVIPHGIRIV